MRRSRVNLAVALTLLTAGSVAAAFAATTAAATTAAAPHPKLVIPEATKDFGAIVTGTDLIHTFVLRNEGNAPLEIKQALPGLGVEVKSFDSTIAPGKAGSVVAHMDALHLSGSGSTTITVFSNDVDHPQATLTLSFEVKPEIVVKPGFARWIYVQQEPTGSIAESVYAKNGENFDVLGVDVPAPGIHATFRPAKPEERVSSIAGSQWKIELTIDRDAPVGAVRGIAVVRTNHPKQKRVPIPLSGFIRPRYLLEPQTADLGKQTLVGPQEFTVHLRNFATPAVSITGMESTIPGITATSATVLEGHRYSIAVKLDPAAMTPGPFQGKLIIRLSDPLQPSLELPLSGELVRPAFSAG